MNLPWQAEVTTPFGVGFVLGRSPEGSYLIEYHRSSFSREDWSKMTPYGGPSTVRFLPEEKITHVDPSTKNEVPLGVYQTKSGRKYTVTGRSGTQVKIKNLDTGLEWWTTEGSFSKRFTRLED